MSSTMNITITTARIDRGTISPKWAVFPVGEDLTAFDEAKLTAFEIEYREPKLGSLIRAKDGVIKALTRDFQGTYDASAYNLAYAVSYGRTHITAVSGPGVELKAGERPLTDEDLEAMPFPVLMAFVRRTDPSGQAVTDQELDALKKPPTPEIPA